MGDGSDTNAISKNKKENKKENEKENEKEKENLKLNNSTFKKFRNKIECEQRCAAAVAVLGGHFETLRVGGRVSLQHTDLTATLLSLRCDAHTASGLVFSTAAHVAVGRRTTSNTGRSERKNIEDEDESSSLKSIHMNTEELVVLPSSDVPVGKTGTRNKGIMFGDSSVSAVVNAAAWLLEHGCWNEDLKEEEKEEKEEKEEEKKEEKKK